jgi:hypothetical protein
VCAYSSTSVIFIERGLVYVILRTGLVYVCAYSTTSAIIIERGLACVIENRFSLCVCLLVNIRDFFF